MRSFVKIKSFWFCAITLSFTDIGKSCASREFFNVSNMTFNAFPKNKIIAKISEFTVTRICLTLYLLVLSADKFCKQFGRRSGTKLFDSLMVFMKEFFEKVDFERIDKKFPREQSIKKLFLFTTGMNMQFVILISKCNQMAHFFLFRTVDHVFSPANVEISQV